MKNTTLLPTVDVAMRLALSGSGCDTHEGLAERAGKQIDEAASDAGKAIEKAGDDLHDATHRGP